MTGRAKPDERMKQKARPRVFGKQVRFEERR